MKRVEEISVSVAEEEEYLESKKKKRSKSPQEPPRGLEVGRGDAISTGPPSKESRVAAHQRPRGQGPKMSERCDETSQIGLNSTREEPPAFLPPPGR